MLTEEDWIREYINAGAYWFDEQGNYSRPYHALLRAGGHSGGFFFSKLVLDENPRLLQLAAKALASKVSGLKFEIDRVVGPATGATKLAEALARELTILRRTENVNAAECLSASPKKIGAGESLRMTFEETGTTVLPGERVLIVEDVVTSGFSAELAGHAVVAMGGYLVPQTCAVVNRSGQKIVKGKPVEALITKYMPIWPPGDCPYCTEKSIAISPKKPEENWELLKQN